MKGTVVKSIKNFRTAHLVKLVKFENIAAVLLKICK